MTSPATVSDSAVRTRSTTAQIGRGLLGSLAVAAVLVVARQVAQSWGARRDETEAGLPGDLLVPDATVASTRAITIDAPPADVWPWIAQLGWERGGFYSYDNVENALGMDVHNASAVCDSWQISQVGDQVHLTEDLPPLTVAMLEPDRHLVLLGAPHNAASDATAPAFAFSWAFVLEELPAPDLTRTRLIVRERYGADHLIARAQVEAVQPASFVMTEKMLRGIRDRAEGSRTPA